MINGRSRRSSARRNRYSPARKAKPAHGPGGRALSNVTLQPWAENGVPATLSERVYRAFKLDLIRGIYLGGEAVGEKALAKRYRGSRTPVREAAVRLQHEGLLRIVPNRGYFVSAITIDWLNQIYEYRAAVESSSAELAARKGCNDNALLEKLHELACTQYDPHDRSSYKHFIEQDTAFHIGVAQLTRNPLMVRTVTDMRCQMERVMYAAIDIDYYGEAPVREHCDILDAIKRHDRDQARQLMYDHILGSRGKVVRLAADDRTAF